MNNYKVNNLHINGKVASGIVKGLWYRVTFDFIPTKEEAIKAIRKSASYNNQSLIESGIKSAFLFPSSVQAVGRVRSPAADFCHKWQINKYMEVVLYGKFKITSYRKNGG